jgi:hypothetical protein
MKPTPRERLCQLRQTLIEAETVIEAIRVELSPPINLQIILGRAAALAEACRNQIDEALRQPLFGPTAAAIVPPDPAPADPVTVPAAAAPAIGALL